MEVSASPTSRHVISTEPVLRFFLFLMLAIGSVAFVDPSPYEFVFLVVLPLTVLGHLVLTRVTLVLLFLMAVFAGAEVLSLMPYLGDRPAPTEDGSGTTATVYTLQTIYLNISALMFAVIFTRRTLGRLRLALVAYAISCVFAAAWAIAGYLDLPGFHDKASIVNRIAGPFKDPNVLGSYCILGVVYLMQATMSGGRLARCCKAALLLFTIFGGIFLPLSRGAWGALAFAAAYFVVATFVTAQDRRTRRGILIGVALFAMVGGLAGLGIASDRTMRDVVTSRAKLEQDYDSGYTGRFGNQMRSIPMLIERPLGFGPHRFTFYFDLDPHNSYIGAFVSAGWVGGIFFILLVLWTSIIGIRMTFRRSPFMRPAQVIVPSLLSAFLQAVQIDVDHWRFVYFMLGAVWGMEAARLSMRRRLLVLPPRAPAHLMAPAPAPIPLAGRDPIHAT